MKDSLLDLKEKGSGLVDSHNILSYTLDIGYNLVIRIHPGYRIYFSNEDTSIMAQVRNKEICKKQGYL